MKADGIAEEQAEHLSGLVDSGYRCPPIEFSYVPDLFLLLYMELRIALKKKISDFVLNSQSPCFLASVDPLVSFIMFYVCFMQKNK